MLPVNSNLVYLFAKNVETEEEQAYCALQYSNNYKDHMDILYNLTSLWAYSGCSPLDSNRTLTSAIYFDIDPINCTYDTIINKTRQNNTRLVILGTNGPLVIIGLRLLFNTN